MSDQAPSIETLYGDHHGWLKGWLGRRMGDSSDAADLAHDTFVRVLRRKPDVLREPRAYLATIANGLLVSHWRRQSLERAWLDALASQPEPVAPSPEERSLILETLEEIARLIDGLPGKVREVFLLSQIDGLSYPQIAEKMGITVNVVQKAMTRAMAHCYKAAYPGAL